MTKFWQVYDEADDSVPMWLIEADDRAEAEQLATERVAETGRDRELDYDGMFIVEESAADRQLRESLARVNAALDRLLD